ncbi:3-dehydroquinate synthase [Fodinibius salinus]|uniref:3-dehydroquinate synthase n=1 Tax=Fodinibius salinus TaxID=860790 RepID=A0A5D3YNK1_9BACT|nr:3-dehydroquinate synthase [Fodinibius salinus]TYP94928.1 3-dehydroquinate synthase [Fodinibius salinus]
MSNINLDITTRKEYPIEVGKGLGNTVSAWLGEHYSTDSVFVVIDENVNNLHRERLEKWCQPQFKHVYYIEIPEGERSKSIQQWKEVADEILSIGVERSTPLMAVGGGVTGDLGGFVASTVLRGLPLIHVPTTLLAMVDSSIGGKTGINHNTGKNLIGAFYQPDAVFADVHFLDTLDDKEWVTGIAEILKYGAIRNPDLFKDFESLVNKSFTANEQWVSVIAESAGIKADIVQEDALESGIRAYLNFGHTFGHALEKVAGYGTITHGEAVFVGMLAACNFSAQLGHSVDITPFKSFLPLYQRQMSPLPDDVDELIEAMKSDKKVKNNMLRLVLLNSWASPYVHDCTDYSALREAWEFALSQFNKSI